MHRIDDGSRSMLLQCAEQHWHVARFPYSQSIEYARIENIYTGINMTAYNRLLLKSYDVDSFSLHDAIGMLPFVKSHGHSRDSSVTAVKIEKFPIPNIGQN